MAAKDDITGSYQQARMAAASNDRKLSPAEFMLSSSPGPHRVEYRDKVFYSKYSNRQSAARAYRKVKTGETTGERMKEQASLYTFGRGKERGFRLDQPRGGYIMGLWKIVVHLNWTSAKDGTQHKDQEKSFIVQSSKYDSYFDAQQVLNESQDAIYEHLARWESGYEDITDMEFLYAEAFRIQTTSKTGDNIVDLDDFGSVSGTYAGDWGADNDDDDYEG